ncbi:hypothetical protein LSTR_LSTR014239 [Laodelphax striatellus]|uniref:DUF4485 domain-containing protein n=1 Tax=Laodelphax striatellus TaxID=195883 RepID=A0A482WPP9_LAOST|nr:hypothetical protein LSTR_LSTR014239 [Laodelphax striatellus]
MQSEMKKLDQDFKHAITAIKPYILQLHDRNQIVLCRLWIEKLIKCQVEDKQLRNIYMDQLCSNLKAQQFGPPFCELPWDGPLSKIPTQLLLKQSSYSDSELWTTDDDYTRFSEKSSDRVTYNTTTDEEQCSDKTSSYRHYSRKRRMFLKPRERSRSTTSLKVINSKKPYHFNNKTPVPRLHTKLRTISNFKKFSTVNKDTSLERVPNSQKGFKSNKVNHLDRDTSTTSLSMVLDAEKACKHEIAQRDLHSDEALKLNRSDTFWSDEVFLGDTVVGDNLSRRTSCSELLKEIQQLQESNDGLKTSLNREKHLLESICTEKIELQQEIAKTNEKLSRLKELEKGARGKRDAFVVEINEQLTFQARRVRQAWETNSRLERELREILENSVNNVHGNSLQLLESKWQEKHRKLLARKQETIGRAEWERRAATDDLESQLDASRQKCIERRDRRARLEKKFQQHFHSLRAQIQAIRDDHCKWKSGHDQRVSSKVSHYEKLIETLKKERCKIVRQYEIRLERMQQTKSMELWVKKFDNYLDAGSDEKSQLEKCLDDLQQEFHKQYSDVIDQA